MNKTIQQIIDAQEHKRPMNKSFNTAVLESKRRIPESARKHMDHKPYKGISTGGTKER